jgi:hypothetical protein
MQNINRIALSSFTGFLFLTHAPSACTNSCNENACDSLFEQTLAIGKKGKIDSLHIEILCRNKITPKSDFLFLNKELSTTVFSKCTTFKAIRIYHDSSQDWLTSISFLDFTEKEIKTVSNLFSSQKHNSFSFKMFNRYFWRTYKNRLVLIESYGLHDSISDMLRNQLVVK